ncbi:hypothetical protein HWV62_16136 [Athelia sp. TMB]|nr:hypothetical protein HWV62_16136 [Athelia sp. TMB]
MVSAYTDAQIDRYLEYIQIPPQFHRSAKPTLDLEFLTALHVHQLAAIPYENLVLHYSKAHAVSLDPAVLYEKLLKNGRGGYCMENITFFNHILRALGFTVYTAGARARPRVDGVPGGAYFGWVHLVIIVALADGSKYAVDVGFGGDGPTKPMPMIDGHVVQNLGTQEVRLVLGNIPEQVDRSQKLWIYQYRNGVDKPWNSFYSFSEVEFLHQDFEVMNWYTSRNPQSFQTFTVLVVRYLRSEGENLINGKVMLVNGMVKRNLGARTEVVVECTTEEERVEALEKYFGITLTDEEKEGIRGWGTELGVEKVEV